MPPLSSLAKRTLSALVLIPIVIGLVIWGGWTYGITLAIVIGIAVSEWMQLTARITPHTGKRILLGVLGLIYLELSFFEMAYLRLYMTDGDYWILVLFLAIWSSDTLAYFIGKNIGGPKMAPTVSPNKTWSGYIGALLGPALVLAAEQIFRSGTFLPESILFGIMIGITGQSGDLLESLMKRKAGVKDSGNLIPGHGGILDRIDALLLVLPVYCAYVAYID